MEIRNRTTVAFAGVGALAILLAAAPVFAAPGAQEDRDHRSEVRRDNERVEHQGHVRSFTRERDGYRIYVDNDERSFWVPADRLNRPLSVGLAINLGGVFRGGLVNVDAVTWPEEHGYGDRGVRNDIRRENERVTLEGHVRSFTRERDGYRVYVDNDDRSFWVPADRLNHPLRVGLAINLGGIFRGGLVNVDAVTWPEEHGYGDRGREQIELRGVVDRIDYRSRTLWLRSDGRVTRVDMRDRDLREIRRGDRVSLGGQWIGGGNFTAQSHRSHSLMAFCASGGSSAAGAPCNTLPRP
jgi:hypothetical protein